MNDETKIWPVLGTYNASTGVVVPLKDVEPGNPKPETSVLPIATTSSLPLLLGAGGTANEHGVPDVPGKSPVESVRQVDAAGLPLTLNAIDMLGAKPVPVAATSVVTGPEPGERERVVGGGAAEGIERVGKSPVPSEDACP